MGSTFGISFVLALTLSSAVLADSNRRGKANCSVALVKEASASSILISFDAESQEECERAKGPEIQTSFTGPTTPKPVPTARPTKKKKK